MQFRVMPIPNDIAGEVRACLKSPQYGHPAHVDVARGYGPCRSCLRTFRKGEEERILFTYEPFAGLLKVPSPGPVFIHKEECLPFDEEGFPPEVRNLPLLLEGYESGGLVVEREHVENDSIEKAISRIFQNQEIDFINVRNYEAGCFIARIERAGE